MKKAAKAKRRKANQRKAKEAETALKESRRAAAKPGAYPSDGKRVPAPPTDRYKTRYVKSKGAQVWSDLGRANLAKTMNTTRISDKVAQSHAQYVATLDTSGETTFEAIINAVVQESAVPTDRAPKRMEGALQHLIAREEYYLERNKINDTVTVHPRANHVHCETTGRILQYRELIKRDNKELWEEAMCRELSS